MSAASGFAYDAVGNLTGLQPLTGLTLTMQYGAEKRQSQVAQSGVTSAYFYGAEGCRAQEVVGQATTYVYDAMGA